MYDPLLLLVSASSFSVPSHFSCILGRGQGAIHSPALHSLSHTQVLYSLFVIIFSIDLGHLLKQNKILRLCRQTDKKNVSFLQRVLVHRNYTCEIKW